MIRGSSPRWRGASGGDRHVSRRLRVIPALAGNTVNRSESLVGETVYPRVGGEHSSHFTLRERAPRTGRRAESPRTFRCEAARTVVLPAGCARRRGRRGSAGRGIAQLAPAFDLWTPGGARPLPVPPYQRPCAREGECPAERDRGHSTRGEAHRVRLSVDRAGAVERADLSVADLRGERDEVLWGVALKLTT